MQELKQGAAYLAIKANCPVIPIYVDGTLEALPDGRIWISPDKIRLKVGNLVYPPTTGSIREKQSQLSEEMQRELLSLKQFMESSKHKK